MSVFSSRRGRPEVERQLELARRLEEHVHFTSLEARAYVDYRLATLEQQGAVSREDPEGSAVSREDLERSTRLAVEEAKAYADEAATSLARSLRGVAQVALKASRRTADPEADFLQRLVYISSVMGEASGQGAAQKDVRASVEQLGRAVEDLAEGFEAVVTMTHEIERILASLMEELEARGNAPIGGSEP